MTQAKLPDVTLDDLIAVNDEIRALVRAGVPLDRGLLDTSLDVRGRLARITKILSERINNGSTLSEALAADGDRIPPVYRAVVEAGLRSGRLAAALEGLGTSARRLADLRRMLGLAMIYPLVVLLVGYAVFTVFVLEIVPAIRGMLIDSRVPVSWLIEWLDAAGRNVQYWWPILPGFLLLLAVWWAASRGAVLLGTSPVSIGLEWILWIRAAARSGRCAGLADVLALLLEHGVPLPEALRLAGKTTGNRRVARETERLAAAAERGQPLWKPGESSLVFPPLLRWLMSSGTRGASLGDALRHAAGTYHRRTARQVDAARVYLPALLIVILGGGITLLLAVCLFLPFVNMLIQVAGG